MHNNSRLFVLSALLFSPQICGVIIMPHQISRAQQPVYGEHIVLEGVQEVPERFVETLDTTSSLFTTSLVYGIVMGGMSGGTDCISKSSYLTCGRVTPASGTLALVGAGSLIAFTKDRSLIERFTSATLYGVGFLGTYTYMTFFGNHLTFPKEQ